ncbi:MAG: hypothetical protein ACJAZS_000047 [Alteromonas naphthalenivorans]|jgi:hypothetical protein
MKKQLFLYLALCLLYILPINGQGFIDTKNSTTATLTGDATFTGESTNASEFSSILVTAYGTPSTATGTLHVDFSPDNINWDRTKSFAINDLTQDLHHSLLTLNQYYRIRYVNDAVAQTAFRLQTLLHTEKPTETNPATGIQSISNSSTTNVGGQTTLNEGGQLSAIDTTVTVIDATVFDNNTTIKIDSEYMSITNISSNDLTVTRGAFNSTEATHEDGATVTGVYIGASELNTQPDVMVSLKSNTAGTEYFDFSNDGVLWDTFPVTGFTVAANIHEFHTAVKGKRYFRIRFENGSASKTTSFRVNTYYGVFRQGNLPLNQTVGDDSDSTIVRAIGMGKEPQGAYSNTKQDGSAFRTTTNLGGTTLSGELASGATGAQTLFTDVSGFAASGYIYIGTEFIAYTAKTGTTSLTISERGAFGTTAATHASAAVVGGAYSSGLLTLEGYTEVATKILCSNTGQMRFQWYSDSAGTDTIRTLAPPYATINSYDFLGAPSFGPYVRYIFANTQSSDTTDFFFETEFYTKSISAQVLTLNSTIVNGMTSNLTRSIGVGQQPDGDFVNTPADGSAFNNVSDGTTTLIANAIYTSAWTDTDGFNFIELFITTDVISATNGIEVQFTDDVQTGQTIQFTRLYTFSSTDISTGYKKITIPTALDGFRVKYTNGGTGQANFYLEATLKVNGILDTVRLNTGLTDDSEAQLSRSVLVGKNSAGDYRNILIGPDDSLGVQLQGQGSVTAFGELAVAQPHAQVVEHFAYNVNSLRMDSRTNQSGAITQLDRMINLQTGAAAESSATSQTRSTVTYTPGEGALCRFTALYTTGVANSYQYVGIGDTQNGFFFGYQGTEFGVCRRTGGQPEVRTLTVSSKASSADNVTITLDNQIKTDVAVTSGTDTTVTANEIAAADYSDVGKGWTAKAVNDTVLFLSWDSSSHPGSYSLADPNVTSAAGTFASTLVGTGTTDTFTSQANWSIDTFDGTGSGGVTLDTTKGNVYQIRYQWLGFGAITYAIENASTGNFEVCHIEAFSNSSLTPSVDNPTLPLFYQVKNDSNTTNLTLKSGSIGGFIEGKPNPFGVVRGVSATTTTIDTTESPILSIRNSFLYNSKINKDPVKLNFISMSVDHTKPITLGFYANSNLVGASFADIETNTSLVQKDTSATGFSGGTLLFKLALGKTGNEYISLVNDPASGILQPGDDITITGITSAGSGGEANVSLNFIEKI